GGGGGGMVGGLGRGAGGGVGVWGGGGGLLGGGDHGGELEEPEASPAETHALLDEEHRPAGVELDRQGDQQTDGRQQQQREPGDGNVDETFHGEQQGVGRPAEDGDDRAAVDLVELGSRDDQVNEAGEHADGSARLLADAHDVADESLASVERERDEDLVDRAALEERGHLFQGLAAVARLDLDDGLDGVAKVSAAHEA